MLCQSMLAELDLLSTAAEKHLCAMNTQKVKICNHVSRLQ